MPSPRAAPWVELLGGPRLRIRPLGEPWEFQEAVEVQRRAWEMADYREAAPAHLLRALADNGGLVLGAFLDGRMVGVSYGWPVRSEYFYSHATGVDSSVKYRGIGRALKLEQRRLVIELYGLGLAKWTFDPLQGLNSRFNLLKLGAISREYYVDYYGEIRDSINAGLGSDRVKAEWHLLSARVEERVRGRVAPDSVAWERLRGMGAEPAIEFAGDPPRPLGARLGSPPDIVLVPFPQSISSVRDRSGPGVAAEWRRATREVYSRLIREGYILVDSLRRGDMSYNVLWRESLETVLSGVEPWRRPG